MAVPFLITATLGPLLIGVILNSMLYGISAIQCFIYYRRFKRDASWIRYFILYLFILETCNTVFDIGMVFEPLILQFGEPAAFTRTPTMIIPDGIVTVLISTPVQYFIAWRIKIVSNSWIMPCIIATLGTFSFIGGLSVTILAPIIRDREKLPRVEPALIVWLASSAAADILITMSLTWSLMKRKTGIKSTDDQVTRIMLLTVQTGTLTTVFALADFIVFLIVPATNINFVFDLTLSKLYTNSLLSTLNARTSYHHSNSTGDGFNLFGQIDTTDTKGSRKWEFSRSAYGGESARARTDTIELDERHIMEDSVKSDGLDTGVRIHKVVNQF